MHLKDKWDMFYIYLKFGQLISWKNDGLVEKFIKENTKAFSKNEKKGEETVLFTFKIQFLYIIQLLSKTEMKLSWWKVKIKIYHQP